LAALERLLETVAEHTLLLDRLRGRWNPGDIVVVYAVLHALQVHAQATLDYIMHVCALLGYSEPTPIRCSRRLSREGLLGGEEAELIARMARFRNIIVHEYGSIDLSRVEHILRSRGYRSVLPVLEKLHRTLEERGLTDP